MHLRNFIFISVLATSPVVAQVRFVNLNNPAPAAPYASWATAATNIQDAVDAAAAGDLVLVTNGVYRHGGRAMSGGVTNRVTVDKPLVLQSVNGAAFTFIEGFQMPGVTNGNAAVRGVYVVETAVVSGFTITNGATGTNTDYPFEQYGGGIRAGGALITNCVIVGNSAYMYAGGGYKGVYKDCTIWGNQTPGHGGGVGEGVLDNCNVISNRAYMGGGVVGGFLTDCRLMGNYSEFIGTAMIHASATNCIITDNWSLDSGGAAWRSTLSHCQLSRNLGAGATETLLYHCAVTDNVGTFGAGGVNGGQAHNCIISNNWSGAFGGGVANGIVHQSIIISNSAYVGGGVHNCVVHSSVIIGNSAEYVGGASDSDLFNSIIYYNVTPIEDVAVNIGNLKHQYYCCTTPLPPYGLGNFTNAPSFVDWPSGDYRLQSNSPCINSGGLRVTPTNSTDFAGLPRVVGGALDVGPHEFQTPGTTISYQWLQQYGLPTDGSMDFADADADGHNTWQEWRADTIPTNALSVLRMYTPVADSNGVTLIWESVPTRVYWLERATDVSSNAFSTLLYGFVGQSGAASFTDTTASNSPSLFYRVGVEP